MRRTSSPSRPARCPTTDAPPAMPRGFVAVADPVSGVGAISTGARSGRARRARPAGKWAVVALLTVVAAVGAALTSAGGRAAASRSALAQGPEALQPGGVTAATTPGDSSSYFSPPALADTSAPGRVVLSGPDAPDPFVLVDGSQEYLYTSNGTLTTTNVPTYTLLADGRFGNLRDAMPQLPPWSFGGFTWAPDVRKVKGGWALYFTAALKGASPAMQCIGDAFGQSPVGPFRAQPKPFICQRAQRGSIDPRTFVDSNGALWLYWKSDDNASPDIPWKTGNGYTGIYAQRLSANGKVLLGAAERIMQPTLPWEGTIVEAPDMVLEQGRYWMFFSGGWFNSAGYAVGVASCAGPLGPCTPVSVRPLLSSNSQGAGPGEESVFQSSSGFWLLYNPWKSNDPNPTPNRPVEMARLGFTTAGPYLAAL